MEPSGRLEAACLSFIDIALRYRVGILSPQRKMLTPSLNRLHEAQQPCLRAGLIGENGGSGH